MQFAAIVLAILLVLPAPVHAANVQVNPTIAVGLFYSGNALPGANLLNVSGTGYRFGYFDGSRNFVYLGATSETAISMVKTQNVYYGKVGNWAGYYDTLTSDIAVGCYHIQLPGTYAAYQEASAAAAAYPGGFAAWVDGVYYVRVGAYLDSASAQNALAALGISGATVAGTGPNGISVVKTGSSSVLFQFDSTSGLSFGVKPGTDDAVKTKTLFRGYTYFGSFQYQRLGGGNITVSNVLPLEDYVQGVIVQEMSPSWPLEALKAQAVCARTYAYRCITQQRHASLGFDICNTVDCQAYIGIATASANSTQAVEATYGQYAFYNGALAETVYFSHDGGATEDAKNVWGGDVPYLKGKLDPNEAAVVSKIENYNWTVTYTKQQLTDLLNSKNYANSGIVNFQVTKTSPTGNVLEITFTDSAGKSWTKTKDSVRTFLGLRSMRYTITGGGAGSGTTDAGGYAVSGGETLPSLSGAYAIDGAGTTSQISGGDAYVITGDGTSQLGTPSGGTQPAAGDTFVIQGSGWGHLVGMSQWGAYSMAQSGATYSQILSFYYTGIDVRQP